ncbi:Crp/Fnr family transcriptional regulator [Cyclobacterium xiamenense]|uniref:Crp/Fnr family transcriptional regulator n=1 Tax=Cyclobacterium xiamenense TaxID=1297121 RepID=UPI0035D12CB5
MDFKSLIVLFRNIKTKTFEKGEVIIQAGSSEKVLFYVRKGLVRSYLINDNSDEITFQLFPEQQPFANAHAILLDEPSRFTYQSLEKSKVYLIDFNSFQKLTAQNAQLLELNRLFLGKRLLKQSFQRVESFVLLSPEERYQKYIRDFPEINNRAPDKYIANVLGVTPVSLSRIRQRIAMKKD